MSIVSVVGGTSTVVGLYKAGIDKRTTSPCLKDGVIDGVMSSGVIAVVSAVAVGTDGTFKVWPV